MDVLFIQIQQPPTALSNSLSLYFPDKQDSRTVADKYNDITIHSDLPGGPFLSGNMAFKDEADALKVANNMQKEIDKYLDVIGKDSLMVIHTRYDINGKNITPILKQEWRK